MGNKKIISGEFPQKEALLERFQWRNRQAILSLETREQVELGEAVKVVIKFPTEERVFWLNGSVIARRLSPSGIPPIPPGVDVEIVHNDRQAVQILLDHAAGKQVWVKQRKSPRVPCSFVVTYRSDADFVQEFATDLGEGGIFIRTDRILPEGTQVECRLKPPGHLLGVKLKCRVVWTKRRGQPTGMGIAFDFTSERKRERVRALVQELAGTQDNEAPDHEDDGTPSEATRQRKRESPAAEKAARRGELALSERRYADAIEDFRAAVRFDPSEPAHHFGLGLARYHHAMAQTAAGQALPDAIRKPFLDALHLDPRYDMPRIYLGYIAKRNGAYEQALKEFRAALQSNPNNQTAATEARVLERRLSNQES